jgi:hypothetical protein
MPANNNRDPIVTVVLERARADDSREAWRQCAYDLAAITDGLRHGIALMCMVPREPVVRRRRRKVSDAQVEVVAK